MLSYLKKRYLLPEFERIKKRIKGRVEENFPLRSITSFGVGGPADLFVLPQDEEDILNTIEYAKQGGLPLTFIGRGTNLLVRDGGIKGIVVSLKDGLKYIRQEKSCLTVGAGVPLPFLAKVVMDQGLSGFEFAWGIPGTVGGAVVMNAGAFGGCIADFLEEVVTLDFEGNRRVYRRDELVFSYRKSGLQERGEIVLEAKFCFEKKKDPKEIFKKMKEIDTARRKTQPIGAKTAGSVFKNPDGAYAGKIIEDLGLKGARIGDAVVSYVHANFIENIGNATARDIEDLILYIKKTVKEKIGIELSTEVEILGCRD